MEETRKCVWCLRDASETTTFNKRAHTIPQSLGGKEVCVNVCDSCNHYFGIHHNGLPPVESIIKEAFILSRYRLLCGKNIGKNQAMPRFKSMYFNVDAAKNTFSLKSKYLLTSRMQEKLGRQLRRGLYKMYLEEIERQFGDGHNPKYNFIREFARYNLGDCPLYYFIRRHGGILTTKELIKYPLLLLGDNKPMLYLINEPGFDEIEFYGHVFGLATSRLHEVLFGSYIKKSVEAKNDTFRGWREIDKFNDMDVTMSRFDR